MATRNEIVAALEAMLFAADEPVTVSRMAEALGDSVSKEDIATALEALTKRINERRDSGLELVEVAGGLQLCTRPELADVLQRFLDRPRSTSISKAALETLAIIAYRQPITRAEVQAIRGVDVSSSFKYLLDRKLVRISGRKEVLGRPFLYSTTRQFLDYFGLASIKDLPSFDEFERLVAGKQNTEEVQRSVDAIEESLHLARGGRPIEEGAAEQAITAAEEAYQEQPPDPHEGGSAPAQATVAEEEPTP